MSHLPLAALRRCHDEPPKHGTETQMRMGRPAYCSMMLITLSTAVGVVRSSSSVTRTTKQPSDHWCRWPILLLDDVQSSMMTLLICLAGHAIVLTLYLTSCGGDRGPTHKLPDNLSYSCLPPVPQQRPPRSPHARRDYLVWTLWDYVRGKFC